MNGGIKPKCKREPGATSADTRGAEQSIAEHMQAEQLLKGRTHKEQMDADVYPTSLCATCCSRNLSIRPQLNVAVKNEPRNPGRQRHDNIHFELTACSFRQAQEGCMY